MVSESDGYGVRLRRLEGCKVHCATTEEARGRTWDGQGDDYD
jgi:hypothetical protein